MMRVLASLFACAALFVYAKGASEVSCGRTYRLSAGHQLTLTSVNYPDKYPNDHRCPFTVVGLSGGQVRVYFDDFELEGNYGYRCNYDFLKVFDGLSSSDEIGTYCGTEHPTSLLSTRGSIKFYFETDGSLQFRGFKLRFVSVGGETQSTTRRVTPSQESTTRRVTPSGPTDISTDATRRTTTSGPVVSTPRPDAGCVRPVTVSGRSGFIQSTGYPNEYENNMKCEWNFNIANPHDIIKLSFDPVFEVEPSATCAYDYIEVSTAKGTVGKYCGSSAPPDVVIKANTHGQRMTIKFITDSSVTKTGFRLRFTMTEGCKDNEFQCRQSGECVPAESRCNGIEECKDGSDEKGCLGGDCGRPAITPASGNRFTERIVGGIAAIPGSWPWQIQLLYRGSHFCGASLLSSDWALSAAHCFAGRMTTSSWKLNLGKYNKSTSANDPHMVQIGVSRIHMHPRYGNLDYDIVLLELDTEVDMNDYISPVCLPSKPLPAGTMCYTTGWGATHGTGNDGVLKQAMVPLVSRDTCNRSDYYGGRISPRMLCAGFEAGGHDACQGDSGGPLACKNEDGIWELHGATSWGIGCAGRKKPGVNANVYELLEWVNEIIEERDK